MCCPGRRHYYGPLRLPLRRPPFPLSVIGGHASRRPQRRGRGGPLQFPRQPSDRSTPSTPGGSSVPAPGSGAPSVAFAHCIEARLPLGPLARCSLTTLQASLGAADRSVATPSLGCRHSASTAGSRPTPGISYRGPWRLPGPDSHRLAAVSLSLGYVMSPPLGEVLAPELLDAHAMTERITRFCCESAQGTGP